MSCGASSEEALFSFIRFDLAVEKGAGAGAGAGAKLNAEELEEPPNASPKKPSPLVWPAAGASHDAAAGEGAGAPQASPLVPAASNAGAGEVEKGA